MKRGLVLALLLAGCPKAEEDTGTVPPTRCETLGLSESVFDSAGTGALNGLAGDFTLTTRSGTYTMSEDWSGCDTLVFILSDPRQNGSFPDVDLWADDHADLLSGTPDNVHYFFVANDGADVEERLDTMARGLAIELSGLPEEERHAWEERFHFVQQTPSDIEGWLGTQLTNPGWGLVIDRAQTVRYMGSFADANRYNSSVGWFAPNLSKASNEARYSNFVVDRQERLDAEDVTTVTVWDGEEVQGNGYTQVTLPSASEMAGFDTLEFDLTTECVGAGEFGDCPAWDYLVYLYQCDDPVDDVAAHASTACQQHVPEVLGTCAADGTSTVDTCRAVSDCEDSSGAVWTCDGFVPSVDADTLAGACADPLGGSTEGTYTCNDQGTGYDDLACPCGTEVGRWITTYHREGRWVHDATPFLAMMQSGGIKEYRFRTSQPYDLTLDFRFSNRGVGVRPTSMTRLFRGGYYGPSLNDSYQPIDVAVPSGASRVELATVVSGHGGGQLNCGEFCHTTNHFFVDRNEFILEDDWVDESDGCEQQVDVGTVPNQYGTWWYGRNGWCPGKEVPVGRIDLTSVAVPGTTVRFEHETFGPGGIVLNGGGGERIELESWLVGYE